MRTVSVLAAVPVLLLAGCHRTCGTWAPIWLQADCGVLPVTEEVTGPGCALMVEVSVDGASSASASADAEVALAASVTNVVGRDVTFTVFEPCPDGLVTFGGLGDGYDYYGSCLAGACQGSGEPVSHTLAPGEAMDVSATLLTAGDACNAPVDAGDYEIFGSLPLTDGPQPTVCERPATLTVE